MSRNSDVYKDVMRLLKSKIIDQRQAQIIKLELDIIRTKIEIEKLKQFQLINGYGV